MENIVIDLENYDKEIKTPSIMPKDKHKYKLFLEVQKKCMGDLTPDNIYRVVMAGMKLLEETPYKTEFRHNKKKTLTEIILILVECSKNLCLEFVTSEFLNNLIESTFCMFLDVGTSCCF